MGEGGTNPAFPHPGLSVEQFADLCRLVLARLGSWSTGRGRPSASSLGQGVKVTVMYAKNHVTEEFIGEPVFRGRFVP